MKTAFTWTPTTAGESIFFYWYFFQIISQMYRCFWEILSHYGSVMFITSSVKFLFIFFHKIGKRKNSRKVISIKINSVKQLGQTFYHRISRHFFYQPTFNAFRPSSPLSRFYFQLTFLVLCLIAVSWHQAYFVFVYRNYSTKKIICK